MTGPNADRPEPGRNAGLDEIQADIEHTREELGQTVQALGAKLDVKARTKEKVSETKHRLVEKTDTLRQSATDNPKRTMSVAAVAVLAVIGIIVWRRRC